YCTRVLSMVMLASGVVGARSAQRQAVKENTIYTFTGGADGGSPNGGVIGDTSGNLVVVTFSGGTANLGTVFKVDKTGKETVLYSFTGSPDGEHPSQQLVRDKAGNLY